jgi:two-component system chemotaxis response regulator CheB
VHRKIKVLVLDDSLLFREVLARGLSTEPSIEVVAKAEDPYDAIDKIERFEPDVITCDVHMPKMDGIEFIRQLLPQHPVPIIVVSSLNHTVFDALNAGAIDFLNKPDMQSPQAFEVFIRDLISKVKEVSKAKILSSAQPIAAVNKATTVSDKTKVIAIGASTGGTEAIFKVLSNLPEKVPGILIVQHIPPMFSKMFADRLNQQTKFEVLEAKNNDLILPGRVLIAPGDQHMRVRKIGDQYKVEVFKGDRVNGHCPSVDVMMLSVAQAYGDSAIGVILTGMGYDGAKGLLAMKRKGARTLGQDEATSVVYGMPKVAFEVGAANRQVPLEQIASAIVALLK